MKKLLLVLGCLLSVNCWAAENDNPYFNFVFSAKNNDQSKLIFTNGHYHYNGYNGKCLEPDDRDWETINRQQTS